MKAEDLERLERIKKLTAQVKSKLSTYFPEMEEDTEEKRLKELFRKDSSLDTVTATQAGIKRNTRVIAVTSGKGGVGKSNFVANMGLALASIGKRVLIMDADLGMANIDVILGIKPQYNLYHVLNGQRKMTEIIHEGPYGLKLVAGASGFQELANLTATQREYFLNNMLSFEDYADIILIDTSAGISKNVLNFCLAAGEIIVVTTPEPTSITDAYGIIKALSSENPELMFHLLINRIESIKEAQRVSEKISNVARQFLNVYITPAGYLYEDKNVSRAIKKKKPFFISYPETKVSTSIRRIVKTLFDEYVISETEPQTDKPGMLGFINRLKNYLSWGA